MKTIAGALPAVGSMLALVLALSAAPAAARQSGGRKPGEGQPSIEIGATARVSARVMTLGDIARVSAPEAVASALRSLEIGPAPPAGFTSGLARATLIEMLRSRGFPPESYRLDAPLEIAVISDARSVSGRDLVDRGRKFLIDETSALEPGSEVEVASRAVPADAVVLPGRTGIDVDVRFRPASPRTGRNVVLEGVIAVDGERAITVPLLFEVRVLRDAVVAARAVARGEALVADALTLRKTDVSGSSGTLLSSVDAAVGLAAARSLRPGDVLAASDVYRPPLVKKGDPVLLRVRSGRLTVTARGIAKGDGARGALVSVTNADSGRAVTGRVVDVGLVEVAVSGAEEEHP